ncbi:MAG TPA: alpha/beta fold hydrolase [Candidatus Acidoferrales bacterium]|nr:alpha/beta fold hydrolase [Candidatus Acidoferrales bacterium]
MIGEALETVASVARDRSASATIDALTPIWQRMLVRSSICPEDNFFDLGGNPPLACKLFDEIAQLCGRELSPVTIFRAPTIAALAELLDQPATPVFPPTVLLKAGAEQPPIFIAHGLGSSVMEFFDLVKHVRTSRPIYGLQSEGTDGAAPPFVRIEGMAQFHVDAIRNAQPHGPYTLIGYSLGGVVAFEIAQRLSASGEEVALLAMIDSYPHAEPLTLRKRIHLIAAQLRYRVSDLMRSAAYRPVPVPLNRVRARARLSDFLAWTRYRPRFYDGKITFVRAESSHYPDPAATWSHLASSFEIETVPGDHRGILSANSTSLALILTRHLKNEF